MVRKELENIYPQLQKNMRKVCGDGYPRWGEDLLALSVTFFLEKPLKDQLKTIENGKLENFITWIANMQLKSSSSKFYSVYRKPNGQYRELYNDYDYGYEFIAHNKAFDKEEDEVVTCIKCEIEKLDPYLKMLVNEKVLENNTFTFISNKYNINYNSLKADTTKAIKKIKKKCQDLY